jgi:hypothetical protein
MLLLWKLLFKVCVITCSESGRERKRCSVIAQARKPASERCVSSSSSSSVSYLSLLSGRRPSVL